LTFTHTGGTYHCHDQDRRLVCKQYAAQKHPKSFTRLVPEDGSKMPLQNISNYLPINTASYCRKLVTLMTPLGEQEILL
jgi:hypothetical protein